MHTFQRSKAVSGQGVALSSLDTSLQCITGFSALGQSRRAGAAGTAGTVLAVPLFSRLAGRLFIARVSVMPC